MSKPLRIFLLLVAVSLFARVAVLVVFGAVVARDTAGYTLPAINIVSGNDYFKGLETEVFLRTPGYPVFLAGIYAVAGRTNFVVALLQQIMVLMAGIFVFMAGRRAVGELPALIGVGIFLFNPYSIVFPNFIMPEHISIFTLSASILLLLLAMQRNQPHLFFASGLLLGYHILCKPSELLLPLVFLVPLCMNHTSLKRAVRFFLLLSLGVVLVVLPWLWYNYARTGNLGFSPLLGRNLALNVAHHTSVTLDLPASVEVDSVIQKRGDVSEAGGSWIETVSAPGRELMEAGYSHAEVDRVYLRAALKIIREKPFSYVKWQMYEFWEFWKGYDLMGFVRPPRYFHLMITTGVGLLMLPLFLLGVFGLQLNPRSMVLILTTVYFALVIPIASHGCTRFRFPVEPYIWIYAANGLLLILSSVRKRLE